MSIVEAQRHRYAGWLPEGLLALGLVSVVTNWVFILGTPTGPLQGDPYLAVTDVVALGVATYLRHRRPELPVTLWVTLMPIGAGSLGETLLVRLLFGGGSDLAIAWMNLAGATIAAGGIVGFVHTVALFPEGHIETRGQRLFTSLSWLAVVVPLAVALSSPTVPLEYFIQVDDVPNPLHVLPWSISPGIAAGGASLSLVALIGALVIVIRRYRRGEARLRRRIRWLMVPLLLLLVFLLTTLVFQEQGQRIQWIAFIVLLLTLPPAFAVGILEPSWLNGDRVLRRMFAFAVLWLVIAGAYVVLATAVGTTAGQSLPVELSVALAVVVAILFQPARRRLERIADRWVFGRRADRAELIAELGSTLSQTFHLDSLLDRMAGTIEEGLDLTWARVGLGSSAGEEATFVAPVMLGGEQVGVVECGPRRRGAWTAADRELVQTFADQAALAISNVRLARRLEQRAAEVAASRARLVKAQEVERRRLERNIHDGVQQDLVALIGLAGQAEVRLEPGDLRTLRDGLVRVLGDLRDLAVGIHPSVLSDNGLLAAIEGLAGRHRVPVDLRADPALRSLQLPEETEGACYFTVAEALANSAKHASAGSVAVVLSRSNGAVEIRVADDGVGFDPASLNGVGGLAGLQDRLAGVGGHLDVQSAPGKGTTIVAQVPVGGCR